MGVGVVPFVPFKAAVPSVPFRSNSGCGVGVRVALPPSVSLDVALDSVSLSGVQPGLITGDGE